MLATAEVACLIWCAVVVDIPFIDKAGSEQRSRM
jgi:hypothetical protein